MSSIQKVAKQALVTFLPRNVSRFVANFEKLRSMINTVTPVDINLDVPVGCKNFGAPVSYINICESPYFTLGVFILKSDVCIPLHDHPGMHGICKVLYGSVSVKSYDNLASNGNLHNNVIASTDSTARRPMKFWFNGEEEFSASNDPCTLTPTSGNFHSIEAHKGQAAFLDILAPPYVTGERDCTYFRECRNDELNQDFSEDSESVKWLVEIPQPQEFYCDSLLYQGPTIDLRL